jgi:Carboxypeptidase regulatory-like domain/TonB dependent receptor-like, beta-barrel
MRPESLAIVTEASATRLAGYATLSSHVAGNRRVRLVRQPASLPSALPSPRGSMRNCRRASSLLGFVPVVFLLLVSGVPVRAQECCRVEGTVVSAAGTPIAGADMLLLIPGAKAPQRTTATADGRYGFGGIKPGTWIEVRVMQNGRPIATSFTLVTAVVETLNIKALPDTTSPTGIEDLDPMGGDGGTVRGVVRAPDGSPVAGARVSIGGTPLIVSTDSQGRYSLGRLRSKLVLDLQVSAPGFERAAQEVTVPIGGLTDADFALAASAPAAEATLLGLAESEPDRTVLTLARAAVAAVPSLTPADSFRATGLLPVAAIGLDASELVAHGNSPDETAVVLDGMSWYSFPRLSGGLTAPIDTSAVQRTEVSATAADSDTGGQLGGAFSLETLRAPATGASGNGEVGVFGPSAGVSVPLAGFASVTVAGRHSWPTSIYETVLDRFAGKDTSYVRDRDVKYSGGTLARALTPAFSQLNGRVDLTPAKGTRAFVSFYRASDAGNFSRDVLPAAPASNFSVPDPLALPDDAVLQIGDVQSWQGRGMNASWQQQWADNLSTSASLSQSRFSGARDQAFFLTSPATAQDVNVSELRGGTDALTERNDISSTTARVAVTALARFAHAITAGVERAAFDTTYDARNESRGAMVPLLKRTASTTQLAAFAQDSWRAAPSLTLSPGIRVTHDDLTGTTYADARATASYAAVPGVVLKGSWSISHQAVNSIVREDREHGDATFWTVSDGAAVPIARAQEAAAGVSVQLPQLRFDGRMYYRTLDSLTLFAPRLLPGAALTNSRAALYTGSGTAAGLELLVQHRTERNGLWASYAVGRVEYTYPTLEAATFPASFDRLHQLKVSDTARLRGSWTVTGVWLAASGLPYTPSTRVEEVWFATGGLAVEPGFGAKNSARAPAYHQLDLSTQIARHFGPVTSAVGITVFNVYDRHNVLSSDYEAAGMTAITSDTLLMRRAANVFFKVGF